MGLFFYTMMKFSLKTQQRTQSPRFLNLSQTPLNHVCEVLLPKLDVRIIIYFNTIKKEELEVEMLNYYTDYKGDYLGVIDAFFQLIQNRPIEAIDRFPIKELDYFLRDVHGESAFSGYSQEIYEILSIGESIKIKIFGDKKLGFKFNPEVDGHFFDLSTSEQYELLEELFAYYVYPNPDFPDEIEIEDITSDKIILSYTHAEILSLLNEKLYLK